MTLQDFAYPAMAISAFGVLASLALLLVIARQKKLSENAFLLAALGTLACLYGAQMVETHLRLAAVGGLWRWRMAAATLRFLFMGFAIHDATRVVLSVGGERLPESDRKGLKFSRITSYLLAFGCAAATTAHNDSPGNWFLVGLGTSFSTVVALLRFVRVLRPPQTAAEVKRASAWWMPGDKAGEAPISLGLTSYSRDVSAPLLTEFEARNLSSLFAVVVVATLPGLFEDLIGEGTGSLIPFVSRVLLSIGLLPCFFGMVQFHARALFFDVVVKQGILAAAPALVWGVALPFLLPRNLPLEKMTVLVVFAIVVSGVWTLVFRRADGWLDRLIFQRPDYTKALQSMVASMTSFTKESELAAFVTSRLAEALRADWIEFHASIDKPVAALVQVASGERVFGYLLCGPRYRSQPYRSEDLQFLETIAAHFGGSLQGFEAARWELKALRAQINPHFLFNALNTLADMAQTSPETERTILNLARVFRFALDSTRLETVPLREELAFIRSYLEIEQARFESKLRFSIDVPEELLERQVPPMLIQPLVENAVKHGISSRMSGGCVRVAAHASANGFTIVVEDDGAGFEVAGLKPNVGLENVRQRVEALVGVWAIESTPGKGTSVSFEVAA